MLQVCTLTRSRIGNVHHRSQARFRADDRAGMKQRWWLGFESLWNPQASASFPPLHQVSFVRERHIADQYARAREGLVSEFAKILLALTLLFSQTAPSASYGRSARQWLDDCRILSAISPGDETSLTPTDRLIVADCKREAARVWCGEGYVVIGEPLSLTPGNERLAHSQLPEDCPHPLIESRPAAYALDYWKTRSLPFWSGWFSSTGMFSEAFRHRWPRCLATRARLGAIPPLNRLQRCIDFHVQRQGQ